MKKLGSSSKVTKKAIFVKLQIMRLGEKTYKKKQEANRMFAAIGDFTLFFWQTLKEAFSLDFEFNEFLRQCFQIGYKTVPLISVTGMIMGAVLTIQSRPVLADFGAVSLLPGMVAASIIREMGPVITALICAGKIGSGIGAELGSMKVSEQIDAMEVSSTHPIRFLVVTRVLAATLMIPVLVMYADALGILGSWAAINIKGSVSFVLFFHQAFRVIDFMDFFPAVIKTFFFGAAIGLVGCYKGYTAAQGTESVGKAANSAVVIASLLVIIIDLIAVQITDMLL
ncbi:MlaE family ABC transporter permease [Natronoflexus pectinivorans]|uniref:Phospholipid/cholesterol/gamma-HCH transport system permease protein n=1 Tax=Natronoflexus pectinivorans TaxID=682526 RepID=A0A4R2GGT8_9BACT|nr:ABC transporter permease [Natronoflexus pectinivorans]TCO07278.1 phospholipid/cholesterol/gamma-HCH transport system permease protein [Natronoflexus pectinivorans]